MIKRGFAKYFASIAMVLAFTTFPACDKEKDYDEIPFAYINIFINPNSTFYWELNSPGGWIYLVGNSPSRGILVRRGMQDDFVAYERTCPYDPLEPCARIWVEPSNLTVIDSCCGSRFIITDGWPIEGPARRPLKQYRTSYNGTTLHIFN